MMNGVEILASSEIVAEVVFNWFAFTIVFVIITIIAAFVAYAIDDSIDEKITTFFIIAILLGGFLGLVAGVSFVTPTKYETHYKVTIDDSVSMNEFLDKYEILDQEGKIYTVKERDND